jgi:hypothetical protein
MGILNRQDAKFAKEERKGHVLPLETEMPGAVTLKRTGKPSFWAAAEPPHIFPVR